MRTSILSLSIALVLCAPPAAAAAVGGSDFRLPTPSPSPAPGPSDRQGPIAPDVPESRRPQAIPVPTPTPAPQPAEPVAPPVPAATSSAAAEPPPPAAAPDVRASPQAAPATPMARRPQANGPAPIPSLSEAPAPPNAPASPPIAEAAPVPAPGRTLPWGLLVGVVLGLALAGCLVAWLARQRSARPPVVIAPRIEKTNAPPPGPAPAPPAAAPARAAEPLQLALEPVRLSLTLMNAALAYRLEVANLGWAALDGLRIEADMISAHASLPREEQLGGPESGASRHTIDRLEPGESRVVEGEFRLPFNRIVPIRQGDAALLLPLARFRAQAAGTSPVVRTFVVGQPGSAGLQPFRLDLGPRIYPNLAQRAFA